MWLSEVWCAIKYTLYFEDLHYQKLKYLSNLKYVLSVERNTLNLLD